MLIIIWLFSAFCVYYANCKCNQTVADTPRKESGYDIRPNLFIDRNRLLGQQGKLAHDKFTYGTGQYGVTRWWRLFPKCAGKRQSPIDIEVSHLRHKAMPKLKWNLGYCKAPASMEAINNGHTIMVKMGFKDEPAMLEGGPLSTPYTLHQIHFHWSASDRKGSEHTINKRTFPMELHAVHYRSDMNLSAAECGEKGLAIVAYLFEIGDEDSVPLDKILYVVEHLRSENEPIELPDNFMLTSLLYEFNTEFVTYQGSLTTPPCCESVTWLISPFTIVVSKRQMQKLRSISIGTFGDNYRPTQPANGREAIFVT